MQALHLHDARARVRLQRGQQLGPRAHQVHVARQRGGAALHATAGRGPAVPRREHLARHRRTAKHGVAELGHPCGLRPAGGERPARRRRRPGRLQGQVRAELAVADQGLAVGRHARLPGAARHTLVPGPPEADVGQRRPRLGEQAAARDQKAQRHAGRCARREHVPAVGRATPAAAVQDRAVVDDQRGVAEDEVDVAGDQAVVHVDPRRLARRGAARVQRVLVADQPHALELHAVGLHRQRHALRAAALAGARRVADAQAHRFERVVGDGQVRGLEVGRGDDHRRAAQRADDGQRAVGLAGMGDVLTGALGLAAVGAADDDHRAGIGHIAQQRDRRLAGRHADPLAVDPRAQLDHHPCWLAAALGHRVDRGLQAAMAAAAVGRDDQIGAPGAAGQRLRRPGRGALRQVVGHVHARRRGGVELRALAGSRAELVRRDVAGGIALHVADQRHRGGGRGGVVAAGGACTQACISNHADRAPAPPAQVHQRPSSARYRPGSRSPSALNSTARSSGVNEGCGCVTWRLPL